MTTQTNNKADTDTDDTECCQCDKSDFWTGLGVGLAFGLSVLLGGLGIGGCIYLAGKNGVNNAVTPTAQLKNK